MRAIYRFIYITVPVLGSVLTDTALISSDSIEEFPSGAAMCELMMQHGFRCATFQPLTGGIVTVYTATKQ